MLLRCLIPLFCLTPFIAAEDWTRFRGPNGQGAVENVAVDLQFLQNPPLWKAPLPGIGASSPIIDGNRVYITSAVEEKADDTQAERPVVLHVRCLDISDGNVIWDHTERFTAFKKHRLNTFASTTPVAVGDRLFFSMATPKEYTVAALDKKTGKPLWNRKLGPFVSENGIGCSLMVVDGLVIVPNEQKEKEQAGETCEILALNETTGETVWRLPRTVFQTSSSTACIWNGQLITTSSAHGVSGIDPKTGEERWSVQPMKLRVVSSPAIAGDSLFVANGVGGVGREMFAVRTDGKTATVAYALKKPFVVPYVPTSVAARTSAGIRLFTVGDFGDVNCVDPVSGKTVGTVHLEGTFYGSPIVLGNVMLVVSFEGTLYAVEVADTPTLLGKRELGAPSKGTPAYSEGRLFLRTDSEISAFRL